MATTKTTTEESGGGGGGAKEEEEEEGSFSTLLQRLVVPTQYPIPYHIGIVRGIAGYRFGWDTMAVTVDRWWINDYDHDHDDCYGSPSFVPKISTLDPTSRFSRYSGYGTDGGIFVGCTGSVS